MSAEFRSSTAREPKVDIWAPRVTVNAPCPISAHKALDQQIEHMRQHHVQFGVYRSKLQYIVVVDGQPIVQRVCSEIKHHVA